MAWKYSSPYTIRDVSSSRDSQSKFGVSPVSTSRLGIYRQSRWSASNLSQEPGRTYRISTHQTDQSPIRTKASVSDNPSSVVQRLKERYSSSDNDNRSEKLYTSNSVTARPYGRSFTTLSGGSNVTPVRQTSYEAECKIEYGKSPGLSSDAKNTGLQKRSSKLESRFRKSDYSQNAGFDSKIYSPKSQVSSYTSRFLPTKSITNHGSSTEKQESVNKKEENENEGEIVTVVARGTSPSQTTSTIYLRSRRNDLGIEKKIHCPKIKPPFSHKETQTDRDKTPFFHENIDVTPALRRRREQNRGKSPDNYLTPDSNHQPRYGQSLEVPNCEPELKKLNGEFSSEMKDRSITGAHQNGIGSPIDEKNVEVGDMSGMISKAKAGLIKSKTKLDVRKSSSREMSPKVTDQGKNEIDLYWKELVNSINRPLRLCDLDFTDLHTDDETDILGNHREDGVIPPPPPPMLILPPNPNKLDAKVPIPPVSVPSRSIKAPAPPPLIQNSKNKKTVKLFWKEVKDEPVMHLKPSSVSLIWDELSKVNVDTQKLEHLFESRAKDLITKKQQEQNKSKEIIVLDHKRSNAINIGMTKLPPPRAIKTAILKMDSTVVNKEGIEKLLTMLPTEEERLQIQDAQNSNPDLPLGSAEQFLLILASISELEARLRLWAFKLDFENVEKEICEPLMDLKQGIEILRTNKTFRAILSTLLSIGNFLNGCDVKGFQIDYLSKVPEVKDTVQKHSLLHHLCAIVMEKFPESTDLYSEIGAVTRASKVDFDELTGNIKKIEEECKLSWNHLKMIAKHEGHTAMKVKMSDFLADCAERIIVLGIVHKRIISRFHKFVFWLGIPMNRISITRPNEIFKIISEFALEYRTTRERILQQLKKMNHREKSRSRGYLVGDSSDTLRKLNSKEAKDDAKLRQLLGSETTYSENMHQTNTLRRHRKDARNLKDLTNGNDDEIIETLIKTANQIPSHRPSLKDRRRNSARYIDRNY